MQLSPQALPLRHTPQHWREASAVIVAGQGIQLPARGYYRPRYARLGGTRLKLSTAGPSSSAAAVLESLGTRIEHLNGILWHR
jgi:hypothetical protein